MHQSRRGNPSPSSERVHSTNTTSTCHHRHHIYSSSLFTAQNTKILPSSSIRLLPVTSSQRLKMNNGDKSAPKYRRLAPDSRPYVHSYIPPLIMWLVLRAVVRFGPFSSVFICPYWYGILSLVPVILISSFIFWLLLSSMSKLMMLHVSQRATCCVGRACVDRLHAHQ